MGQARAKSGPGLAAIRARLPDKLKTAALHAIKAEDHYVRIHTSPGSDLVLLRFADALDEADGIDGAQVHRSWWVARNAVEGSRLDGGKRVLIPTGGADAPVSRAFAKMLRDSGWFA